ncbi:MAG: Ig-like domain-containing protein [Blastocatellia bacterium]
MLFHRLREFPLMQKLSRSGITLPGFLIIALITVVTGAGLWPESVSTGASMNTAASAPGATGSLRSTVGAGLVALPVDNRQLSGLTPFAPPHDFSGGLLTGVANALPAAPAPVPALVPRRLLADNTVAPVTVSAASYETSAIAPESIVAAFGTRLATGSFAATDANPATPELDLPTDLGGTSVRINGRLSGLFFVSPGQVNYQIPAETTTGTATVQITSGDGTISSGTVQVSRVAPGLFTANSDGAGVPAAYLIRVKASGETTFEAISQYNATTGRFSTKAIDMGPAGEKVFLVLFLSGIQFAADNAPADNNLQESVHVILGGVEITPDYAGKQGTFRGLDQINMELPRSLIGRGRVSFTIVPTGYPASRACEIEIAGAQGSAPPQVSGFGSANALAGQPLSISGSGFSLTAGENLVRIGGTEAKISSATATLLSIIVPFGAETGAVSVRTPLGEGASSNSLSMRTSVSGFVEDTGRAPMRGVRVKMGAAEVMTNSEGLFVVPDVGSGAALVEIDANAVTTPPFPKVTLKMAVSANRDNQFARPVSLQQATGPGLPVGSGSAPASVSVPTRPAGNKVKSGSITTDNITLDVPGGSATFPDGSASGNIFLTLVDNSRTPVDLPIGHYSTAIVQITPFGVTLNPGGKLSFPNPEGWAAGSTGTLFRFEQTAGSDNIGRFVEAGAATVTPDGQRIETINNAIASTGIYFISRLRQITTVAGRVVDNDGSTPVRNALVRLRGQETFTDGNGGYVLRSIPVKAGETVSVEASFQRPDGRIDRQNSREVPVIIGGVTQITPDIVLPATAINRPPVIQAPASITIAENASEDRPVTVTDPDQGQTVNTTLTGPGFASLLDTGSQKVIRLAPNYEQAGAYTLTLTATDNLGAVTTRNIPLKVTGTNRAPVATGQSVTTDEDTAKSLTLTGSDADGDTITFVPVDPPAHGSISGTGANITYTPAANYNGPDQFRFKVNDGQADSAIATVNITINPVNDAPVAQALSRTLTEDQPHNFTLAATDADGDTLTYAIVGNPAKGVISGTAPSLTYTPNANENGADSLTFKVSDGKVDSNTATVTFNITAVNDAPVANGQSVTTNEDTALNITLSGTDVEGSPLTYAIVTGPAKGTFSGTAPNLVYTPNANLNGTDSFTFKVNDGSLDSAVVTVSITITAVNDAPVANGQSVSTNEDTPLNITLSGADIEGSTLAYSVVTTPVKGTLSGTAPNLIYTPNANANGSDSFIFKVNDGTLDSGPATVSVSITPVNDAPVANSFPVTLNEDTATPVTLSGFDVEGSTLGYAIVTPPTKGVLTGVAPNLTYVPNLNATGADSIVYKVNDGQLDSANATVSMTINAVNDPPAANGQTLSTNEDTSLNITLTGSDIEGSPLTFAIAAAPANGTITGTGANRTYMPNPNFNGNDSFKFKVNDGQLDSPDATVNITVIAVNDPPVANGQTLNVNEDTPINITLSGNDIEGSGLTYMILSAPASGTLSGTAPNVTYTPNPNYNGSDSFSFKVNDGTVDSAPATISLTVNPVNDPPAITVPGTQAAVTEDLVSFVVSGSDPDAGQTLTYTVTGLPPGANFDPGTRQFTWTPQYFQAGTYSLAFTAEDDGTPRLSDTRTVSVVINPILNWAQTNGPAGGEIFALRVNSASDIVIGTFEGIYKSNNGGTTWTKSNGNLPPGERVNGFAKIVDGGTTYHFVSRPNNSSSSGVYRTTDQTSYTAVNNGLSDKDVQALLVIGTTLYAATDGGGIFKTTDFGANWSAVNTGLQSLNVYSLASDGTRMYAGTDQGISESPDFGANWSSVNIGLPSPPLQIRALLINGTEVYAGVLDRVYQNTVGGSSWSAFGSGLPRSISISSLLVNGTNLYVGTIGDGVYAGDLFDTFYNSVNTKLLNPAVNQLAILGGQVAAATMGGVSRYDDVNNEWNNLNTGIHLTRPRCYAQIASTIYAGTQGSGLHKSTDNGATWTLVNEPMLGFDIRSLLVVGSDLFVGTGESVFKFDSVNTVWTSFLGGSLPSFTPVNGIALMAGAPEADFLVAVTDTGVFMTNITNAAWTEISPSTPPGTPYTSVLVTAVNEIYVGTAGDGVYYTNDGGSSLWTQLGAPEGLTDTFVRALTFDGTNVWAATRGGVFIRTSNSTNWAARNSGLGSTNVHAVHQNSGKLFAGTVNGVFYSTNGGVTWKNGSFNLLNQNVHAVFTSGSLVFAGTDGSAAWKSNY